MNPIPDVQTITASALSAIWLTQASGHLNSSDKAPGLRRRSSSGASFILRRKPEPQSRHLQSWSRIFWLRFANQTWTRAVCPPTAAFAGFAF